MRYIILIFFFLASPALSAETFKVRSGEHADFSRLVILFGDTPDWRLGRVSGGYELRVSGKDIIYDFSRVYELIPRERIEALEMRDESRFFIKVTCDCYADAFEIRQGLVIDVKDGPASNFARFESAFSGAEDPIKLSESARAGEINPQSVQNIFEFTGASVGDYTRSPRIEYSWGSNPFRSVGTNHDSGASPNSEETNDSVNESNLEIANTYVMEIRDSLVRQISNAAGYGLVETNIEKIEDGIKPIDLYEATFHNRDSDFQLRNTDVLESGETQMGENINFSNAVTREMPNRDQSILESEQSSCNNNSVYDISSWGIDADYILKDSILSAQIYDDLGEVDSDQLEALVKYYIYFSFGAEARSLLESFPNKVDNYQEYFILSQIIELNDSLEIKDFRSNQYCEDKTSMWSALAYPFDKNRVDEIPRSSIISHFSELPIHLRRYLGPRLAARFFDISDLETVKAIEDAISRAPGEHGDGLKLISASLELRSGDKAKGTEKLGELVKSNGEFAPRAMVEFLRNESGNGRGLDQSALDMVDIMAIETSGSELSVELRLAQIDRLVKSDEHENAIEILTTLYEKNEIDEAKFLDRLGTMYQDLMEKSLDEVFLNFVFDPRLAVKENMDRSIQKQIAERLIALGFSGKARDVLSRDGSVLDHETRRLFAHSYLEDDRSDLAIGYLAGLSDQESMLLRADAYEKAGSFEQAAEIYFELGDTRNLSRISLAAENWDTLAQIGTEKQKSAVEILLDVGNEADEDAPSILKSEEILLRSENTRNVLEKLVNF